ncbi:MAG: glycerol kinase GlpK [Clostridia bacterium]|nr:glycerol kinase GlpK [Clostridia bacterium]
MDEAKKYVLALDEGTTSARAILFDREKQVRSVAQQEFTQIYPQPGWVEHDAMQIYATQYAALTECIARSGVSPEKIAGIGITNQRETTVVWEKRTGKPIYNAIVWQCRRTTDICEQLAREGYADYIQQTTGLKLDAYFSGTKIKWILDHVEGAREKAERGELLFGTVDTWLLWKLTDGAVHVTDRTNASRTMLYNINTLQWDEELCRILGIPMCMLPEVRSSSEVYGYMNLMGAKVPICGIAGDQQAALFGQGCVEEGDLKITYGTGCFLLTNTGETPVFSRHGLVTTIAATVKDAPVQYALEGSVFTGGAVIQWLRDELRLIHDSADSEYFAKKVPDNGGVYIVPAFTGLGAPYWDMRARGTITGLTRGAGRNHIIRAALEAIAFQSDDVIAAMRSDTGGHIHALKVDGGASANNFLMQFQSDISDLKVIRPDQKEATAAGAAYLAGLAVGFYDGSLFDGGISVSAAFEPRMIGEERQKLLTGWHSAVAACQCGGVS